MAIVDKAVGAVIRLLQEGNEADRCYAAQTLGRLNVNHPSSDQSQELIDSLIECLRDEDLDVCIDAASALGAMGSSKMGSNKMATSKAIPALLDTLEKDPEPEVKIAALDALKHYDTPEIKSKLEILATNCPDDLEDSDEDWDAYWDIQLKAIETLGKWGHQDAAPALLSLLDEPESQDIEIPILKALANMDEPGLEALLARQQHRREKNRRRATAALAFCPLAGASDGIVSPTDCLHRCS